MSTLADRACADLGMGAVASGSVVTVPLAARTAVAALAHDAVAVASAAAAGLAGEATVPLDAERVAVAVTSERWLRLDGAPPTAFAPLSGFFRTRDGWVRTHGNYPHHAAVLRAELGLAAAGDRDAAAAALEPRPTAEVSAAVTSQGGLCVPVAHEDRDADERRRAQPLLRVRSLGAAGVRALPGGPAAAPLRGIRVLDLTRVIAGPVATRTLALLGAEVLRLDPPRMPEISWQHLDTGHGKRSALLDLASDAGRSRFAELLAAADIVALGYRSAALDRLGLTPEALAAARPGVIVLRHSAWGDGQRRGFDSLVQAASGIAWLESADGSSPGALPAQALDHATGYLLAAAAMTLLARRAQEGGSWLVETSLRRVAAELLGMPRTADRAGRSLAGATGHVQSFEVAGLALTTAAPAIAYRGAPEVFPAPRPWGGDVPEWRQRPG